MAKPRKMSVKAEPQNFQKQHKSDAGYDLRIHEDVTLFPGRPEIVPTDVRVEIPSNCVGLVMIRSSLGKQGITLANGVGVIDSGYRGEVKLELMSVKEKQTIFAGTRVAQMLITPLQPVDVRYVEELKGSDRGEEGIGSTGKS